MAVCDEPRSLDIQEFIHMAEDSPQAARSLLRKSQQATLNQRLRERHTREWHQRFTTHLLDAGFQFPEETILVEDSQGEHDAEEGFLCPICAKCFDTPHQTATHLMRAHVHHADHYLWANRTSCLACMQEFHTWKRLAAHFQHGGVRCLAQLKAQFQSPD